MPVSVRRPPARSPPIRARRRRPSNPERGCTEVQRAGFGRLIMLAHPESDDSDRLLAAAKCAAFLTAYKEGSFRCLLIAADRI
ncbi:hypothetical protein [Streptomyces sp. 4N124]|uniref:hypothetical protein n=1 Tax=Streptomyces sp. 4N124 TaxID=3457420 RepID=UPI003FD12599